MTTKDLEYKNNGYTIYNNNYEKNAVVIKGAVASWTANSSDYTLNDINVEIRKGYLTMIVGPIASGKVRTKYVL